MTAEIVLAGAAAGVLSNEAGEKLHPSPTGKEAESHLKDIYDVLCDIKSYFKQQPQNKFDTHKTLNLANNNAMPISFDYNGRDRFLTLHILVNTACTLTANLSGVGSVPLVFASVPTAGQYPLNQYVRWRFPDRTTLTLTTPVQSGYFPVDILYSDEIGD